METRRSLLQKLAAGAFGVMSGSKRGLSACLPDEHNTFEGSANDYQVKVNCAGPAMDGFSADQPYRRGGWGYTHGGQYFMCDSVFPDYGIPAVIKTLRYSCGAPFHYRFDVPNGYYRIKMYFVSPNEFYGPRTFDVVLNGKIELAGFRPFPVNTGILKQFDNNGVSNGQIDITFRSINDACLINAIEVERTSTRVPPPAPKTGSRRGSLLRAGHDDLLISYYGGWTATKDSHYSSTAGSALDFCFKGSAIRWIGSRNLNHGIAEVYIDGNLQQTVDTYAPTPALNQVLFEKDGLSQEKYHTFRMLASKDKASHSTGICQDITAFECNEPFNAAESDAESAFAEVATIEAGKKSFLAPGEWRPVRNGAGAPERGVSLQDGLFRSAFDRNVAYQVNNWNLSSSWTTWLPGANDGRRMAGASNILRWIENSTLRDQLDALVRHVASRQRADGYALPYPDTDMGKVIYGANNERKPYDRRNFTLGLLAAGRANPAALQVARKFQDWLYSSPYIKTMLDGALGIMGDQPNVSMYHTPAAKPDDVTTQEEYWRQDWWLDQLKDQQALAISRFPLNRPHCYVLAPWVAYCGVYRAMGEPKLIDAMLSAWQTYNDNFVHIGGSAAICEDCDNAYPYKSYYLHKHTGENCGGAFWIDFNHHLLQLYPEQEKFASQIEQTLYNVTLANQDSSGNIRYHTNLVEAKDQAKAIATCCEVTNTTILARLPEFLYSIASDGLFINLYSASTISWTQGGTKATLKVSTDFPNDANVSMALSLDRPLGMKIRLRIPSWSTEKMDVLVNRSRVATGVPGTYAAIERTWSDGDAISFTIPMGFRLTKYTGFERDADHDRYALQYGPLLMSLVGGTHLNIVPAELTASFSPLSGSPLQFSISGHPNCKYMPYLEINDEPFTCFPNFS
jgi:hypothetical protein